MVLNKNWLKLKQQTEGTTFETRDHADTKEKQWENQNQETEGVIFMLNVWQ